LDSTSPGAAIWAQRVMNNLPYPTGIFNPLIICRCFSLS
jgi:hypothetical protein